MNEIPNINFQPYNQPYSYIPQYDMSGFQYEMGLDALGYDTVGRSMVKGSPKFNKEVMESYFKNKVPFCPILNNPEFIKAINSIEPELLNRASDATVDILKDFPENAVLEKLKPFTLVSKELIIRTTDLYPQLLDNILYNRQYGLKDLVEKTDKDTFRKIDDTTVFLLSQQKNILTSPEHIKSRVEYFKTPEYRELANTLKEKCKSDSDVFENALQAKLISSETNPDDVMEYIKDFDIDKLNELAPRVKNFAPKQLMEFLFYHAEKKTELTEENLKYKGHLSHDTQKELVDLNHLSKILSRFPNTNRQVGHLPAAWMEGVPKAEQKEFTQKIYDAIKTYAKSNQGEKYVKQLNKSLDEIFGEKTKVEEVGFGVFGYVVKITVGDKPPFALKTFGPTNSSSANVHGASIEPQNAMFAKGRTNNFAGMYFGQLADVVDRDGFMVSEFLTDESKDESKSLKIGKLSTSDASEGIAHNYIAGKLVDYGAMYVPDKELLENENVARYVRIIADNLVMPKGAFLYGFNDKRLKIVKNFLAKAENPEDVQKAIDLVEKYGKDKIDSTAIARLRYVLNSKEM